MNPVKLNPIKTLALSLALVTTQLFTSLASAEVREIKSMNDIEPAISRETLLVFDIDNTILEPTQTLGSDQWGMNEIKRFKESGLDDRTAIDSGVRRFADVQLLTQVKPVEAVTPQLILRQQLKGVRVLALTARPLYLMQRTLQELKSIGVNLQKTAPQSLDLSGFEQEPISFSGGVIAVGPHNNKGEVLKKLISQNLSLRSLNYIFVDDKQHHVESMEKFLGSGGAPFVGFRYGAADAKVKAFDPRIGDLQYNFFKQEKVILSDEQAKELLQNQLKNVKGP